MFITQYWNDQGSNLVMNPANFSEFLNAVFLNLCETAAR
jgi:hypothetical protein